MSYLALLPGLLCGLAVCIEDVRHRRVPRAWIAVGVLVQFIALVVYGVAANDLFVVPQAVLFGVLSAAVQCALALVRPGALGFGDVTCTLVIGLTVGASGLIAVATWWLLMGVLGLVWTRLWLRFDPQSGTPYAGKVPFAPVIVAAGMAAVPLASLL